MIFFKKIKTGVMSGIIPDMESEAFLKIKDCKNLRLCVSGYKPDTTN